MLTLQQFSYNLPPGLIAQTPASPRDHSRLLVLNRETGVISHHHFYDLPNFLSDRDVIVRNNTKVIPARIFGTKPTGGKCEVLLIKALKKTTRGETWECLTRPGLKVGQVVEFYNGEKGKLLMTGTCVCVNGYVREVVFSFPNSPSPSLSLVSSSLPSPATLASPTSAQQQFLSALAEIGHTPIPPDIHWEESDEVRLRELYQTTYAKIAGSAAAPTAGLHFTPELDEALRDKGVDILEVTLHVGLGTFANLTTEELKSGHLHSEWFSLSAETAQALNTAKKTGKRVIAVGTTTTRVLEHCAKIGSAPLLSPLTGSTTLMIAPPYKFQVVDALITNFHYPQSSLLTLVSAFVTKPNTDHDFRNFLDTYVGHAYKEAIQKGYRFYSFGDSMFIV